jgi:hypothetical protein
MLVFSINYTWIAGGSGAIMTGLINKNENKFAENHCQTQLSCQRTTIMIHDERRLRTARRKHNFAKSFAEKIMSRIWLQG